MGWGWHPHSQADDSDELLRILRIVRLLALERFAVALGLIATVLHENRAALQATAFLASLPDTEDGNAQEPKAAVEAAVAVDDSSLKRRSTMERLSMWEQKVAAEDEEPKAVMRKKPAKKLAVAPRPASMSAGAPDGSSLKRRSTMERLSMWEQKAAAVAEDADAASPPKKSGVARKGSGKGWTAPVSSNPVKSAPKEAPAPSPAAAAAPAKKEMTEDERFAAFLASLPDE